MRGHVGERDDCIVGDAAIRREVLTILSASVTITCARSTRPWTRCTRPSNEPANIGFSMSDSPAESLALSELEAGWERDYSTERSETRF